MILSNRLYRSLRRVTTCRGELKEHNLVKPTISEKKMETDSKLSGSTDLPATSCSPIKLEHKWMRDKLPLFKTLKIIKACKLYTIYHPPNKIVLDSSRLELFTTVCNWDIALQYSNNVIC